MDSFLHRFHFFSRFLSSPRKVGSVTPSSRFLVNALLKPVPWQEVESIVELGAGTGVVTEKIQNLKNPSCQTVVFEIDPYLSDLLKKRYSEIKVCSDAHQFRNELLTHHIKQVDCVISCLPFTNFSPEKRNFILQEVKDSLKPGGLFIAFQYSLHIKPILKRLYHQVDIHFVPWNLPPAFVYICR